MATNGRGEKTGLGKFVQKQSGYGTTKTKLNVANDSFIKHIVKPGETVQGIALKYGVTMEQLKRDNQIWTNDSLFLREYLLVPLVRPTASNSIINRSSSPCPADLSSAEIVSKRELEHSMKEKKKAELTQSKELTNSNENDKQCAKDFLSRFDSSLTQIKTSVKKLEEQTNFPNDSSNPLNHLPTKKTSVYGYRQGRSSGSDTQSSPELVIKSTTRSKQIKTSIENLESTQEDLFQL